MTRARRSRTDDEITEIGMKLLGLARAGELGKDRFGRNRGIYPAANGWTIGRPGDDDTVFLHHIQAHAVAMGKVSFANVPPCSELWMRGGYSWDPEARKPPAVETVYNRSSSPRRKAAGVR